MGDAGESRRSGPCPCGHWRPRWGVLGKAAVLPPLPRSGPFLLHFPMRTPGFQEPPVRLHVRVCVSDQDPECRLPPLRHPTFTSGCTARPDLLGSARPAPGSAPERGFPVFHSLQVAGVRLPKAPSPPFLGNPGCAWPARAPGDPGGCGGHVMPTQGPSPLPTSGMRVQTVRGGFWVLEDGPASWTRMCRGAGRVLVGGRLG